MNENLNLVEILKDCPKGTKLYSPIYGNVKLANVSQLKNEIYPIIIKLNEDLTVRFTGDGRIFEEYKEECMLFPSREQRDWSKFKVKKPKFDPKKLKPFDRVLTRNSYDCHWCCAIFSHIGELGETLYKYVTTGSSFKCCIPYNDDTKHLVGTTEEAPEYYRYWED